MCTQHSLGTLLTGIGEDMNRELALSTCYKVVLYKKMPLTENCLLQNLSTLQD